MDGRFGVARSIWLLCLPWDFYSNYSPDNIHSISAAVLSVALQCCFAGIAGLSSQLTGYLRRGGDMDSSVDYMGWLGVFGYEKAREKWLVRQLPMASADAVNVLVIMRNGQVTTGSRLLRKIAYA